MTQLPASNHDQCPGQQTIGIKSRYIKKWQNQHQSIPIIDSTLCTAPVPHQHRPERTPDQNTHQISHIEQTCLDQQHLIGKKLIMTQDSHNHRNQYPGSQYDSCTSLPFPSLLFIRSFTFRSLPRISLCWRIFRCQMLHTPPRLPLSQR